MLAAIPTKAPIFVYSGYFDQKEDRTRAARESRPANEDPEGNWGQLIAGCQISMRAEQDSFPTGEPVIARVIIRNVGNELLQFAYATGDPFCVLTVVDEQGQRIERSRWGGGSTGKLGVRQARNANTMCGWTHSSTFQRLASTAFNSQKRLQRLPAKFRWYLAL